MVHHTAWPPAFIFLTGGYMFPEVNPSCDSELGKDLTHMKQAVRRIQGIGADSAVQPICEKNCLERRMTP
jgi:hypothetical protein